MVNPHSKRFRLNPSRVLLFYSSFGRCKSSLEKCLLNLLYRNERRRHLVDVALKYLNNAKNPEKKTFL